MANSDPAPPRNNATPDLLSAPVIPRKKIWRAWKLVGLAVFAVAIPLGRWLPGFVYLAAVLAGIVVIANLSYHGLRRLTEPIFWKVRNRMLGSFLFIGFIPLGLLLLAIMLVGYIALGQLSAAYLKSTMDGYADDVARIAAELQVLLPADTDSKSFDALATRVFERHHGTFPRLAAYLLRRDPGGALQTVREYDPAAVGVCALHYPDSGAAPRSAGLDGIILRGNADALTAIRPIPAQPDLFLQVTAPIDLNIEDRLQEEKSIFAAFVPANRGSVRVSDSPEGMQVKDAAGTRDRRAEADLRSMTERSRLDARRKLWWFAVLEGWNSENGKREAVVVGMVRVPFQTLYEAYFSGYSKVSRGLLYAVVVVLSLFLAAELISFVIGGTISRHITRSIHEMHQGILALQRGDLGHRIPVRRRDQLGLLSHAFNQMTDSITRLLDEVGEKKRLEQELQIAREVQATLFPKQLPKPRGLSLFGGCEPARVVSGDYYDFIVEDEAHLHIVVADISGKGISAALLMANLQAAMRNQLLAVKFGSQEEVERNLAAVMNELNQQIYLNSPAEKYATLFLGRYVADKRSLSYSNAGHLPPIILNGDSIRRLETGGTVLGLFDGIQYQAETVELPPGSLVSLYTDGITEAVNDNDEEFGEQRLLEALREYRALPPEIIFRRVVERVRDWQGKLKQQDDITLIVGKVD